MQLRLSPRMEGRAVYVLIRSGETEKSMHTCGLLTFNVSEYRAFLNALRQGAASASSLNLRVDDVQLGGT